MSILKRLAKSFQVLLQELLLLPLRLTRWLKYRMLRSPRGVSRSTQAGFILPTVVMVILVVTLLTTTIVFRSFDRAKNASNVRVNQVVLNAALPAIERAKRKLDAAFEDPTLPRGTPTDLEISRVLSDKSKYTLGDEMRLQVAFDIDNSDSISSVDDDNKRVIEQRERITTAWRYPVDTNGNGLFDSFTLYGLYFRSPDVDNQSTATRERKPLDARTPPQSDTGTNANCAGGAGTTASVATAQGWFKIGDKLKKGFYIYTATVPITDIDNGDGYNVIPAAERNQYEAYSGNLGFTALEYQQDRSRIPLGNNAVVYEDDLEFFSGPRLNINGRIVVNSNANLARSSGSGQRGLYLYQVSSPFSCFYEAENAKIIVGGNVTNTTLGNLDIGKNDVEVHLFQGQGVNPKFVKFNQDSASDKTNFAGKVSYNNQAYEERIELLVKAAKDTGIIATNALPEAIQDRIKELTDPDTANPLDEDTAKEQELTVWFRNRTRRVPFNEVPFGQSAIGSYDTNSVLQGKGTEFLRPPTEWILPNDNNTKLNLFEKNVPAYDPDKIEDSTEKLLGDRIIAGNNLPALWYNGTTFADANDTQDLNEKWTSPNNASTRYRKTQVKQLVDLGLTNRDGFWETKAAEIPENRLASVGGLRIVTGAGVYLPQDSDEGILSQLTGGNVSNVVWPDYMPMIPEASNPSNPGNVTPIPTWMPDLDEDSIPDALEDKNGKPRPFLKMRASAVYHYTFDSNSTTKPKPIACVSSYYDPTDSDTAQNRLGGNASGTLAWQNIGSRVDIPGSEPQSNNGITYNPPSDIAMSVDYNDAQLGYQARLVYPNGRLVNPRLAKALNTPSADRTLADRAAIDSTLCALQILNLKGNLSRSTTPSGYPLPDGAIQEVAFLDGREIKAIEGNQNTQGTIKNLNQNADDQKNNYDSQIFNNANVSNPETLGRTAQSTDSNKRISQYDLAVELRQPLEIRVTAIDLDKLRKENAPKIATGPDPEWMLPASGIIYATRDDGLPDASNKPTKPLNTNADNDELYELELTSDSVSATDFWLDPTRRPNGILLINGSKLGHKDSNEFDDEEKGLILASNLPVYIKGNFNVHDAEEFTETFDKTTWSGFYDRKTFNKQFACRKDDPRLDCQNGGDNWRAVSVLSDSLALLSDQFRFGFRNEGDYDLRNNETDNLFRNYPLSGTGSCSGTNWNNGSCLEKTPNQDLDERVKSISEIDLLRRHNGFFNNSFITNGLSSKNDKKAFGTNTAYEDTSYSKTNGAVLNSSYFNNFVTPVQRRKKTSEYLMEMCQKLPVSSCTPGDWVVGFDYTKNGDLRDNFTEKNIFDNNGNVNVDINGNGVPNETTNISEETITSEQLLRIVESGFTITSKQVGAGTTALSPLQAKDQKYPRRVAFQRINGNLKLELNGQLTPISLGIKGGGDGAVSTFPYLRKASPSINNEVPREVDNALWFRGSNRNDGQLWISDDKDDYQKNDRWLSYLNPSVTIGTKDAYLVGYSDERDDWLLPDMDLVLPDQNGIANILNGSNYRTTTTDNDKPADYLICVNGANGGKYQGAKFDTSSSLSGGGCNVNDALGSLASYTETGNLPATGGSFPIALTDPHSELTDNSTNRTIKIYTYKIGVDSTIKIGEPSVSVTTESLNYLGSKNPATPTQLVLNGNPDTMFVFEPSDTGKPVMFQNVKLVLNGVNPNNIFWISNRGMVFAGDNDLAGNFLGEQGGGKDLNFDTGGFVEDSGVPYPYTATNTKIHGGRFLGFENSGTKVGTNSLEFGKIDAAKTGGNLTIEAITTSHQPLLVPVININRPSDTDSPLNTGKVATSNKTNWIPLAPSRNEFNLIMATGDVPGRYGEPAGSFDQLAEGNGNLGNLPRFLEYWDNRTVSIRGSFIQLQRSRFSTASFQQILDNDGGSIDINNEKNGSLFKYPQRYAELGGRANYYFPPDRDWGFDVGLLSQLPDLFSQRFTLPPTDDPNEYYREVSRDDDWIRTLLCAVEWDEDNNKPETNNKAVNKNQRDEAFCGEFTKQ